MTVCVCVCKWTRLIKTASTSECLYISWWEYWVVTRDLPVDCIDCGFAVDCIIGDDLRRHSHYWSNGCYYSFPWPTLRTHLSLHRNLRGNMKSLFWNRERLRTQAVNEGFLCQRKKNKFKSSSFAMCPSARLRACLVYKEQIKAFKLYTQVLHILPRRGSFRLSGEACLAMPA